MLLLSLLALACSRGSAAPEGAGAARGGSESSAGSGASNGCTACGAAAASGGRASGGDASGGGGELPALEHDTESGVFVHLFEWPWADIARECETFLGPRGFSAVQVSPPSEHAVLANSAYPWWQRYQTVSYALESRSGTRAQFVDMVARCREAGVGIYVDAVLNHMTGQRSGVGSAGTQYTKYAHPGLYEPSDFHTPACQIQGADYTESAERVQRCELVGLADLDTESESVQQKLAGYLSDLLSVGVRGFRIDAAKHMAAPDIAGVLAKVTPRDGESPYYFLEVIDYGGEAVRATDYLDVGGGGAELDVTEFKYGRVGDAFLGRGGANLASLATLGDDAAGLLASERAVVFIDNHDTQRGDAIFYQDGSSHTLAMVFMLAWPYGYPSIMSSFGFDRPAGRDTSPPTDGGGTTRSPYAAGADTPDCAAQPFTAESSGWICEHRQRSVAAMVAFRKATAGSAVTHFWDNGGNQIAFAREGRGFVAINHEADALEQTLPTSLPEGRYCDVLSGDYTPAASSQPAGCSGAVVSVDATGSATLAVPAGSALALHAGARL